MSTKEYYRKNRERLLQYQRKYVRNNKESISLYHHNYQKAIKKEIVTRYTRGLMQCQCPGCTESQIEFMTVDHINEDGAIHRRREKITAGFQTLLWLKNNNFPPGFQILCFNCNAAKSYHGHGTCPHVIMMKEMLAR